MGIKEAYMGLTSELSVVTEAYRPAEEIKRIFAEVIKS
jgi:hypothetical protein